MNYREGATMGTDLQEGFLLLQMFADQWHYVVRVGCWSQFVMSPAPVLISPVFLLQAFQHTAHLHQDPKVT